jgi:hypothetical protein
MISRPLALALVLAAALAAAPAASAAMLSTDARCYQETQEVVLSGSGYAPMSTVTVSLDSELLGTAQTDANGAFERKFATPELSGGRRETAYVLGATDTVNTATTRYRASKVFADFAPASGDPTRLRVRFSVFGFGLRRSRAPVYLHYVLRSTGKVHRTILLGTARGICGVIRATKERRLFPFEPERGTWILQFDTVKRYTRATSKRTTPWVRKPVEVYSRGG